MSAYDQAAGANESVLNAASVARIRERLAANVLRERERSGLTQERLGTLIQRDRQTISRIENAQTDASISTLVGLSLALRVSLDSLLDGLPEPAQDRR
jgi:transcriptional regulator with XRE-family HTH domain